MCPAWLRRTVSITGDDQALLTLNLTAFLSIVPTEAVPDIEGTMTNDEGTDDRRDARRERPGRRARPSMINIQAIDHVVFRVVDLEAA